MSYRDERDFGLETETETRVVSVSVSAFETRASKSQSQFSRPKEQSLSLSLKIWDWIPKSQSQSQILRLKSKSLGLSLKMQEMVSLITRIYFWLVCQDKNLGDGVTKLSLELLTHLKRLCKNRPWHPHPKISGVFISIFFHSSFSFFVENRPTLTPTTFFFILSFPISILFNLTKLS